jgi:hypothetical protein
MVDSSLGRIGKLGWENAKDKRGYGSYDWKRMRE